MNEYTEKFLKIKGHMIIYDELRELECKYDRAWNNDELMAQTYNEIKKMLNTLRDECLEMVKTYTEYQ